MNKFKIKAAEFGIVTEKSHPKTIAAVLNKYPKLKTLINGNTEGNTEGNKKGNTEGKGKK